MKIVLALGAAGAILAMAGLKIAAIFVAGVMMFTAAGFDLQQARHFPRSSLSMWCCIALGGLFMGLTAVACLEAAMGRSPELAPSAALREAPAGRGANPK